MSNRCLHATTEINYNILVEEMTAFYLKFKGIRSLFCWGGGGCFFVLFLGFFFFAWSWFLHLYCVIIIFLCNFKYYFKIYDQTFVLDLNFQNDINISTRQINYLVIIFPDFN